MRHALRLSAVLSAGDDTGCGAGQRDAVFAGSLNLYSDLPHGFGELDEAFLRLYVAATGAALANARRYADVRSLADQLARRWNPGR